MPITRELADALIEVVRERMAEQGLSVNALARGAGLTQQTLDGQLKGRGKLGIDEWEALAVALGEPLEGLLTAARRRL